MRKSFYITLVLSVLLNYQFSAVFAQEAVSNGAGVEPVVTPLPLEVDASDQVEVPVINQEPIVDSVQVNPTIVPTPLAVDNSIGDLEGGNTAGIGDLIVGTVSVTTLGVPDISRADLCKCMPTYNDMNQIINCTGDTFTTDETMVTIMGVVITTPVEMLECQAVAMIGTTGMLYGFCGYVSNTPCPLSCTMSGGSCRMILICNPITGMMEPGPYCIGMLL